VCVGVCVGVCVCVEVCVRVVVGVCMLYNEDEGARDNELTPTLMCLPTSCKIKWVTRQVATKERTLNP
jgi:hypothetical protein